MQEIDLLLSVAIKSGRYGSIEISTGIIAKELGVSQQTISVGLRKLEKLGFINRSSNYTGIRISLTDEGYRWLDEYRLKINKITKKVNAISGEVFTGVGQGRFYTSVPKYKRQFKGKLGIVPHPGTLNLKIDQVLLKSFLDGKKMILIEGFSSMKRVFGSINAYPVKIKSIRCAALIPKRTFT